MRLERINAYTIRCYVTKADLQERKISLRELRYGNQATIDLFHEVVDQASAQFNFNEEQLPLMIEAVPLNPDEIVITISAVDDAEEMDPHFAHYAPDDDPVMPPVNFRAPQPFLDVDDPSTHGDRVTLLSFENIDSVIRFCHDVGEDYPGWTMLFRKEPEPGFYLAILKPVTMAEKDYHLFLNSASEYADFVPDSAMRFAYLEEHSKPVMEDVLHTLNQM